MSTYRPRGSAQYVFDFRYKRRRFLGPTGKTSKREADEIERQEREHARDVVKRIEAGQSAPLTIDVAADRYWLEAGQHRSNSKDLFRDLGRLVDYFGATTLLSDISDPEAARMVAWRRGHYRRGKKQYGLIAPAHVNRSTTEVLQRLFTRAQKVWKLALPDAPNWRQHMLAEPQERVRELRHDEDAALTAAFDPDYEELRKFSLLSGLRQRASLVRWRQVDFNAGVVIVVGKGGKIQRLPMTPAMREILLGRRGHHPEWVFTYVAVRTQRSTKRIGQALIRGLRYPITFSGIKTHWRRRRAAAGIVDYRWHDNRHTFATNLLRTTGNLKLVKRALDHSKLETTDKYAHVLDDEVRAGMTKAEQKAPRKLPRQPTRKRLRP